MTDRTPGIEVRWLRWEDASEAILELRRKVYVEEQGIAGDIVTHPRDPSGLHLAAAVDGVLVACVSIWVFEAGAPELATWALAPIDGLTVQFGKRLELRSHRGHGITEVLVAGLLRYVYESLRPGRLFIVLRDVHRSLQPHYARLFNAEFHAEVQVDGEAMIVMTAEGEAKLRAQYLKAREMAEGALRRCPVVVPSLVRFLADEGRAGLFPRARLAAENLYATPLSLADELPRLAAQNRLLFAEQRPRLAATPFPPVSEGPRTLVDVGTGTGVYLALIAKEPALASYRVKGVEPSPQLIAYARFAYPDLEFAAGSAYDTGEPDDAHDVVCANFVFIHLRNPDLALLELRRILKPGGLLYVVDVNDSTFTGPDEIRAMIEAHHRNHEGDRTVLSSLPRRAAEFGLEPVAHHRTTVRNTGGVEPSFAPGEVRLGRMGMWGMLAFMGHREEIDDVFQVAQEHYLGSDCEISLDVETQVYRKPLPTRTSS
ncbi:MAG: class I SAM-dependent methyltransferase [Myxococcales bacterium]|nr:class I SAM-dependent methyltransferase [Myxococcales bacterium]